MEIEKPNFFSLYQTVGEISGKMDALAAKLDGYIAENKTCYANLCKDVDNLKAGANVKKGERTIIGMVAGVIGGAVSMAFSWFIRQ